MKRPSEAQPEAEEVLGRWYRLFTRYANVEQKDEFDRLLRLGDLDRAQLYARDSLISDLEKLAIISKGMLLAKILVNLDAKDVKAICRLSTVIAQVCRDFQIQERLFSGDLWIKGTLHEFPDPGLRPTRKISAPEKIIAVNGDVLTYSSLLCLGLSGSVYRMEGNDMELQKIERINIRVKKISGTLGGNILALFLDYNDQLYGAYETWAEDFTPVPSMGLRVVSMTTAGAAGAFVDESGALFTIRIHRITNNENRESGSLDRPRREVTPWPLTAVSISAFTNLFLGRNRAAWINGPDYENARGLSPGEFHGNHLDITRVPIFDATIRHIQAGPTFSVAVLGSGLLIDIWGNFPRFDDGPYRFRFPYRIIRVILLWGGAFFLDIIGNVYFMGGSAPTLTWLYGLRTGRDYLEPTLVDLPKKILDMVGTASFVAYILAEPFDASFPPIQLSCEWCGDEAQFHTDGEKALSFCSQVCFSEYSVQLLEK